MNADTDQVLVRAPDWDEAKPLREVPFETVKDLPAGWIFGGGLRHDHEEHRQTDAMTPDASPDGSERAPPTVERLGEPRHPRIFLGTDHSGVVELYGGELQRHRCDRLVYTFFTDVSNDDAHLRETALDLDRGVEDIRRVQALGTREGDHEMIFLSDEAADAELQYDAQAEVVALRIYSDDEIPTLFRWWAAGCIRCDAGGGSA